MQTSGKTTKLTQRRVMVYPKVWCQKVHTCKQMTKALWMRWEESYLDPPLMAGVDQYPLEMEGEFDMVAPWANL